MSSWVRPIFASASLLLLGAALSAQRPLTHDDYDSWRSLRGQTWSQDGNWIAYSLEQPDVDGVLEVRSTTSDKVYTYALASGPRFTADNRFVVFRIGKSKVAEHKKKIDELRKQMAKKGSGEAEKKPTPAPAVGPVVPEGGRRGFGGRRGMPGGAPGGAAPDTAAGDMGVLDLATGKVEVIKKVKSFTVPDEVAWLVYQLDKPEPPKTEAKPGEEKAEAKPGEGKEPAKATEPKATEPKATEPKVTEPKATEPKATEPKATEPKAAPQPGERPAGERGGRRGRRGGAPGAAPGGAPGAQNPATPAKPEDPLEKKRKEGTELVVRDLASGSERRFADVVSYSSSRKTRWLYFQTSAKKPVDKQKYGVFVLRSAGGEAQLIAEGIADWSGFTTDRQETALAFTSDLADFAADKPQRDIYLWDGGDQPARCIVKFKDACVPKGRTISGSGLSFSRDASVIEFALQALPAPELPPILPEDKVVLDIWNWRDGQLQTAQQKGGRRDAPWSAVYHRDGGRVVVLGDDKIEQVRFITPDGSRAMASDSEPYEQLTTWDGRYADVYLINTIDGSRQRVLQKQRGNVSNSPDGRYLIWFGGDYRWWTLDIATLQRRDLTGSLQVPFHNVDDDHPEPDPAYGLGGWAKGDEEVVIYDEFDLWRISPRTGDAVCVTDGYGRSNHLRLRLNLLDREDEWLPDELMLSAADTETMAEGYCIDALFAPQSPKRLVLLDKNFGTLQKAKKADRLFFTLSTFADYPDLWTADATFGGMKKLTNANPQQAQFRWGTEELVSWIDADGKPLKGILIKPDGFDPSKQYPMLVYFYERMSQNLHNYVVPQAGTSPCASYYVSNGYLFFMPDIRYEVGYPGASCVKCVVSGVQSLIAKGFVDPKGIGAAGHSWGGYQTAFLATRTDIFAALESGAPVSNMISAYGGIRYGTGVSRQFQYEMTQSRIGGTPWEYPMRYWENSPIFFADKVHTPVLILHNDNDGAVPWTQGIEYFTALRRLGKEAYLFNYNGEDHGLGKAQNKKDWSRRMAEYFDCHLRGAQMPKWMSDGVPYKERDQEKIPFAPSFLEASAKPAEAAQAVEAGAEKPVEPEGEKSSEGSGEKGQ